MSGSYLLIFHIYIYKWKSRHIVAFYPLHALHYLPAQHYPTLQVHWLWPSSAPGPQKGAAQPWKGVSWNKPQVLQKKDLYIYIYGAPPSPAPHPQKKEQNCQNASKDAKSSYNLYIYIYVYSCSHVLLISLKVQQSCQKSKFCWRNAWLPHDTGHEVALANGTAMHRSLKPHFARLQRNYWARKHSNCSRCRSPSAWVAASPWKLLGLLWMK